MVGSTRTTLCGLALALAVGALAGCSGGPGAASAGSVDEQGASQVRVVMAHAHGTMLAVRSRDPEATGQAVVDAFTEETMLEPAETRFDDDGTVTLTAAIAMEEVNADGTYGDEVLGACVTLTATPGRADGEVGQRGTVTTRQVECPRDVTLVRNDRSADRLVHGLDEYSDEVPLPVPTREPVQCRSGGDSDDCPGG